MENLVISKTYNSPEVDFDFRKGELKLIGRAHPENADALFSPIIEWVETYVESPNEATYLKVDLEYFNSSASKSLLKILSDLVDAQEQTSLKIDWHYYDEDSLEIAEDIEALLEFKMNLISEL